MRIFSLRAFRNHDNSESALGSRKRMMQNQRISSLDLLACVLIWSLILPLPIVAVPSAHAQDPKEASKTDSDLESALRGEPNKPKSDPAPDQASGGSPVSYMPTWMRSTIESVQSGLEEILPQVGRAYQTIVDEKRIIKGYNFSRWLGLRTEYRDALEKARDQIRFKVELLQWRSEFPGTVHPHYVDDGEEIDFSLPSPDEIEATEKQVLAWRQVLLDHVIPLPKYQPDDIPEVMELSKTTKEAITETLGQIGEPIDKKQLPLTGLQRIPRKYDDTRISPRLAEARTQAYKLPEPKIGNPPAGMFLKSKELADHIDHYFAMLERLFLLRCLLDHPDIPPTDAWLRDFDLPLTLRQLEKLSGVPVLAKAAAYDESGSVVVRETITDDSEESFKDQTVFLFNLHPHTLMFAKARAKAGRSTSEDAAFAVFQFQGYNYEANKLVRNLLLQRGSRPVNPDQTGLHIIDYPSVPRPPQEILDKYFGELPYDEAFRFYMAGKEQPYFKDKLLHAGDYPVNPPVPEGASDVEEMRIAEAFEAELDYQYATRARIHGTLFVNDELLEDLRELTGRTEPLFQETLQRAEFRYLQFGMTVALNNWAIPVAELPIEALTEVFKTLYAEAKETAVLMAAAQYLAPPAGKDENGNTIFTPLAPAFAHALHAAIAKRTDVFASQMSSSFVTTWIERAKEMTDQEVYERNQHHFVRSLVPIAHAIVAIDEDPDLDQPVDLVIMRRALDSIFKLQYGASQDFLNWASSIAEKAKEKGYFAAAEKFKAELAEWTGYYLEEHLIGEENEPIAPVRPNGTINADVIELLLDDGFTEEVMKSVSERFGKARATDLERELKQMLALGRLFGFMLPINEKTRDRRLLSELPKPSEDRDFLDGVDEALVKEYFEQKKAELFNTSSLLAVKTGLDNEPFYRLLARRFSMDFLFEEAQAFREAVSKEEKDEVERHYYTLYNTDIGDTLNDALLEDEKRIRNTLGQIGSAIEFEDMDRALQKAGSQSYVWQNLMKVNHPGLADYQQKKRAEVFFPSHGSRLYSAFEQKFRSGIFGIYGPAILASTLIPFLRNVGWVKNFFFGGRSAGPLIAGLGRVMEPVIKSVTNIIPSPIITGLIIWGGADLILRSHDVVPDWVLDTRSQLRRDRDRAKELYFSGVEGASLLSYAEYKEIEEEYESLSDELNTRYVLEGSILLGIIGGITFMQWRASRNAKLEVHARRPTLHERRLRSLAEGLEIAPDEATAYVGTNQNAADALRQFLSSQRGKSLPAPAFEETALQGARRAAELMSRQRSLESRLAVAWERKRAAAQRLGLERPHQVHEIQAVRDHLLKEASAYRAVRIKRDAEELMTVVAQWERSAGPHALGRASVQHAWARAKREGSNFLRSVGEQSSLDRNQFLRPVLEEFGVMR